MLWRRGEMASKRKTKKKKRRKTRPDKYAKLIDKLKGRGLVEGQKIVFEPAGEAKMSEVIESFVEPYAEFANTYEEYSKLIGLAVVAWNAALLPKRKQRAKIRKNVGALSLPDSDTQDLVKIVEMMMKRKRRYFSDNTRAIIEYHVSETRDGFHLSVASTL
jgi:hypothetical protein